jgi:large subunit ribosomal protein L17
MKKRVFGRKLKRDVNERKALFASLISSLVLHGRIKTTEAKAKAIKPTVEKLITKAKNKGKMARKHLLRFLSPRIVDKIIKNIAPRYAKRPGGYTRIIKLGERLKDNAKMVIMEFVEEDKREEEKKEAQEEKQKQETKPDRTKSKKSKKEQKIKNEKGNKTNKRK